MGLFDNKYKKRVNDFVQKYINDNSIYLSSSNAESILTTAAAITKMDLEKALKDLNCKDINKYLDMFTKEIMFFIEKTKKSNNNQQALYNNYLARMRQVLSSSMSAPEKKRKLSEIVEEAMKNLTDIFLRADLTISKRQEFERQIDMKEGENFESYLEGGLSALKRAPGARRADAVVREEMAEMMRDLDSRREGKNGTNVNGRRF